MYSENDHPQRRISLFYSIKKKLLGETGKYYYLIWTALFGLGLFAGMNIWDKVSLPGYAQYIIIAFMFLILGISIFKYTRDPGGSSYKDGGRRLLLLVLIPAFIFFMCGCLIQAFGAKPAYIADSDPKSISGDVRIQGRVYSHPVIIYGNVHMDLVLESSEYWALKKKDIISVVIQRSKIKEVYRDDNLEILGELKVQGGKLVLEAWSAENIVSSSWGSVFFKLRQKFYRCINEAFSHYLKYDNAALARALILGDRRNISNNQYEIFRKSGTAHLIAISGMHISFLAAIIYLIMEKICKKSILIFMLSVILLFYNFILGPAASVMRATIWVLGTAAAASWKRKFRSSYVLSISFLLIPMLEPGIVKEAGFWLSFSAMAGIVFIYPVIKRAFLALNIPSSFLDNHIVNIILTTVSIQIICGPLILYYFGSLPLISPVSNLFMLPIFYILLLLLFASSAACILWPPAGGLLLKLIPFAMKPVCALASFFSHHRFPSLEIESMQPGKLFIYYFTIMAVFFIIKIIIVKKFDF
jgi:competence protein ComEC